ncbi:hypothetical protein BO223_08950 [Faecalibaculum rodentium]|uniref:HTH merR-type domain-containing protein n=2 Tax=Faecalibaculum rodentium TaxID=1702221 RepID=A0A1Q9YIZ7_9FIRM|nr:hypothetical protein BO223_08950 [Faecalibaculum rodentium]
MECMNIKEFSRFTGVTEKTLRYFEKTGLINPKRNQSNGYREYSEIDLYSMQQIVLLRKLGFSLNEIQKILSSSDDLPKSLLQQHELTQKQIMNLRVLDDVLIRMIKQAHYGNFSWDDASVFFKLIHKETSIAENYRESKDLSIRISLHRQFSSEKIPWFAWVASHMQLLPGMKVLEIGCGNGELWNSFSYDSISECDVFLTDQSEGMIKAVRTRFGHLVNTIVCSCEALPFKNDYFDIVIANHVLFYLEDIDQGLSEIYRVLKPKGTVFCSTYGKSHLAEITQLCQDYNPKISLSTECLQDKFGKENGSEILRKYFKGLNRFDFFGSLQISERQPLIDYILSCHGNQTEMLANNLEEFSSYIDKQLQLSGKIEVKKDACLFVGHKIQ